MQPFILRLQSEFKDLTSRIIKLESFIYANSNFKGLEEEERDLLKTQLMHMHSYHEILALRLKKLNQ